MLSPCNSTASLGQVQVTMGSFIVAPHGPVKGCSIQNLDSVQAQWSRVVLPSGSELLTQLGSLAENGINNSALKSNRSSSRQGARARSVRSATCKTFAVHQWASPTTDELVWLACPEVYYSSERERTVAERIVSTNRRGTRLQIQNNIELHNYPYNRICHLIMAYINIMQGANNFYKSEYCFTLCVIL